MHHQIYLLDRRRPHSPFLSPKPPSLQDPALPSCWTSSITPPSLSQLSIDHLPHTTNFPLPTLLDHLFYIIHSPGMFPQYHPDPSALLDHLPHTTQPSSLLDHLPHTIQPSCPTRPLPSSPPTRTSNPARPPSLHLPNPHLSYKASNPSHSARPPSQRRPAHPTELRLVAPVQGGLCHKALVVLYVPIQKGPVY